MLCKICLNMRRKLIYSLIGITCLTFTLVSSIRDAKILQPIVSIKKVAIKNVTVKTKDTKPSTVKKVAREKPEVLKTVTTQNSTLKQVSFTQLPGWDDADVKKSHTKSCGKP